jgi:hypothetical protein
LQFAPDIAGVSDWACVTDIGCPSRKGKTVTETLLELMEEFPKYDLVSDEGIKRAILDMGTRIAKVGVYGVDTELLDMVRFPSTAPPVKL